MIYNYDEYEFTDTSDDYFINDYIEEHESDFEWYEIDFEEVATTEDALNTYENEDVLNVEGEEGFLNMIVKTYKDKAKSDALTNIKDTFNQFFKTFNFCELTKERKLREEVITLNRIIITWTDTRFYKDFKEAIYKKYDVIALRDLSELKGIIIAISKNKSYYTTYQEKGDVFEVSKHNQRFLYNETYPVWTVNDL